MEYFNDLLQPWRRVSRPEFVVALTLLSAPGVVLSLSGMMTSASSLLGPLLALQDTLYQTQPETMANLQQLAQQITPSTNASPISTPMSGPPLHLGSLIDNLCLLLLTPFVRGRWLSLGYAPRTAILLTLGVQLSVLHGAILALTGTALLPLSQLWGVFTLLGYMWLSVRGGAPKKPVHERMFHATRGLYDDSPPH